MPHDSPGEKGAGLGNNPGDSSFCGQAEPNRGKIRFAVAGSRIFLSGKPLHDFGRDVLQAAIELNAGLAKTRPIEAMLLHVFAHGIIVSFFTAMFEEQAAADERMAQVAGHRAQGDFFGIAGVVAAAFGMRQSHIAADRRSAVPRASSSIGVPSRYRPAFTSISWLRSLKRPLLVISLMVGTNGKFVMEPLPVVNRMRLQPAPTWPAMLSRSLPGLSMK